MVAADENLAELAPTKEVVTQVAPEPVASEGAASQSQADQSASAPSVDPKKEVETSEPAGPSPIAPAETEKADKPVEQEKTVTVTEKTNHPPGTSGAGAQLVQRLDGTSTPATGQAINFLYR